jgi:hypothetical protein
MPPLAVPTYICFSQHTKSLMNTKAAAPPTAAARSVQVQFVLLFACLQAVWLHQRCQLHNSQGYQLQFPITVELCILH